MTKKLNLRQISKTLMEDMPQAVFPDESGKASPVSFKSASGGAMSTPSYDKMAKKTRTKPSLPKKTEKRNPSANSGPEKAPQSGRIPGTTSVKSAKKVSDPNLKVTSVANSKSAFLDASKVKRSEAEPVKWTASSTGDTKKLIGTVLKGLSNVEKIKFNVSKPNVDYGIVPSGEMISVSHSHKMTKVGSKPSAVNEGVINGTTTVRIGSREHVFEAASVEMVKNMVHNYANVGQEVEIDVKVGLRESYADNAFVTSLFEAIHAKTLDVDLVHKEKIAESYARLIELLENQYIPFHNRSRKKWINECVAPAFKQAYAGFKKIYESHLEPYEVTLNVATKNGVEIIDIITRALNEDVAIHSAVEEVQTEFGASAKVKHGYIGSRKFVAENNTSLLSKALSFDDMPEGFSDAGFGYKDSKAIDPKAPKADKLNAPSKKRDLGATVYSPKSAPGAAADKSVDRKGADKRDKTTRERPAPKKDSGPRWPE